MMKMRTNRFADLCIFAVAIVTATQSYAAAIVKATYRQNGNEIASMLYTGSDGGPNSDRAIYWKLLGNAPESAYRVEIKPDKADGKTATLAGKIVVSVQIRNQFNMGTVKTKKLTLVRDNIESTRWYIPAKELKRIVALIDKKSPKDDSKTEKAGDDETAVSSQSKPEGKKESESEARPR